MGLDPQTIYQEHADRYAATAAATLGFFFGAKLEARILAGQSGRVPEVTGLWWWKIAEARFPGTKA